MERTYKVLLGLFAAVALCKYSQAEWNATKEPTNKTVSCGSHGDSSNCTVTKETDGGHFSKCPDEYEHYCIHGLCRFVTEQNAPACRCESGFTGSRCEYLHLDWLIGDKKQIIIACVVAGLLILIVLIVFIFIGAQRNKLCRKKKRRKEGKPSETEKLNTIATSGPSPVPAETMATNAV